jgi:hypothetical protein
VRKAPKAAKAQAKPNAKAADKPGAKSGPSSLDLVKLADFINPRVLDAAQMVMVVAAALQPKDGAAPQLSDEARAGLVRILQEVNELILGIKSEVSSAVHSGTSDAAALISPKSC